MLDDATRERLLKSLEHNCGPVIMDAVHDPAVIEIMLNPDGKIWTEKYGEDLDFREPYARWRR